MQVLDDETRKQAFRIAYDFLDQHNTLLVEPDEFSTFTEEIRTVSLDHLDNPLVKNLLLGIWLCISEESDKARKKKL